MVLGVDFIGPSPVRPRRNTQSGCTRLRLTIAPFRFALLRPSSAARQRLPYAFRSLEAVTPDDTARIT